VKRVSYIGADYCPFDTLEKKYCGGERFVFSDGNRRAVAVVTKLCQNGNKYIAKADNIETEQDNYSMECK
jgi:hypothetical protein